MTPATAQVLLTAILLNGAVVFVLLGEHNLAVALVGAMAGQGASLGVRTYSNGNGGRS